MSSRIPAIPAALALVLAPDLSAARHPDPACAPNLYYCGPASDHFDGKLFFNPDGEQGTGGEQKKGLLALIRRGLGLDGPRIWPSSVAIARSKPPARVEGERMVATWIGHSTVLIQTRGLNILLDPVWNERDSPVPFAGPRRVREPGVRFHDLPRIDAVLISHSHYDHLDVGILQKLWTRDRPIIVAGLGADSLLRPFGVPVIARDWGDEVRLSADATVTLRRAHHWSARTLHDRDMVLWTAFQITLPDGDIYYAGDTGPGDMQWASLPSTRPIRFAVLPIGAIKVGMPPSGNHIAPEEAVTAFGQLNAAYALGVHWGTFELTNVPIDVPPARLKAALQANEIAADRFRTLEAGEAWDVPGLPQSGAN